MRERIGYILMAIAVLHEVVGVIFYAPALLDIAQAGVINSIVPPFWQRDAAFWFMAFGVLLFLLGWTAQWSWTQMQQIPRFLSWGLLLLCTVGVVLMPLSGLWLGIPVALIMTRMGPSNPQQPMLSQAS